MITILSPAKTQDFTVDFRTRTRTVPRFSEETAVLAHILKDMEAEKIGTLMSISEALSQLNFERYQNFSEKYNKKNSRQAALAFRGDVYGGLDADSLTDEELKYAQSHLRILSGLYGLLRPLDLIQPYRLEMKIKLQNEKGKDLYKFWGSQISELLNKDFPRKKGSILLNLASNEYFKAIDKKALKADIISPSFKENKNGTYKIIAVFAKRARGLMARFVIQNNIENPEDLRAFDIENYAFNEQLSTENEPVFTRG